LFIFVYYIPERLIRAEPAWLDRRPLLTGAISPLQIITRMHPNTLLIFSVRPRRTINFPEHSEPRGSGGGYNRAKTGIQHVCFLPFLISKILHRTSRPLEGRLTVLSAYHSGQRCIPCGASHRCE